MNLKHSLALCIMLTSILGCSKPNSEQETSTDSNQSTKTVAQSPSVQAGQMEFGTDYHSFANPEQTKVTHIDLDLTANFEQRILSGHVVVHFDRVEEGAKKLILDTRDLQIKQVTWRGEAVQFKLAKADKNLGSALHIALPKDAKQVTVEYQTSPQASGVQWLTPAQTAGKKHPFLFTQAQAIHARSFIPLQDSPKVRMTYSAVIRTPAELLAVMSASNDPDAERDGVYEFNMPQPVPSYLIALAIGDLKFKPMGERTGVYAEESILDAAAKEFADTEDMLIKTEQLYGPYSWERYDLLILPPSFPFGGMENPRLSFITPTVIAGDKSLVSLIAHELAHSWSGNTVTNATWRDLWLNEGFTTYLTYRIMEMIYGTDRFKMEAVLGYEDLQADIDAIDSNDEVLAIDLRGRDPDDVFSNIPYEKGALFLREIEHKIGRDNFDLFLLEYFKTFSFKSITTDEFIDYLKSTLVKQYPNRLDMKRINQWIFEPGIPKDAPKPESNAFSMIDDVRKTWLKGNSKAAEIKTDGWTVHQWLYFLNNMPEKLSQSQLAELDAAFKLTESRNNEIAHSWLLMSVNNWYEPAFERLHSYLVSIGRNKLVKPLYRALSKTEKGKVMAQKAFSEAKSGYHPLTVKANEGFVK